MQSPWLGGIWAEVARLQGVIALRPAPRRGSSFPEEACAHGEELLVLITLLSKLAILGV